LRAPGTNSDEETAYAFDLAGGKSEIWHLNRLLEAPAKLADFQVLCLPGGFSYGDDLGAGRVFGNQMRRNLAGSIREFHEAGKLILGICNGFQVLVKTGLLHPDDPTHGPAATLALNESGRYVDRWVRLKVGSTKCVFLQGIEELELPVAHAEGRFVARSPELFAQWEAAGQLALRYAPRKGDPAGPVTFPDNPNGAQHDLAGMCDPTGRVLGLMPHPERNVDPTHHPQWTRKPLPESGQGLALFRNAIRYFN